NGWGLYDMSGNGGELTAGWYGDYPSSSQTDPTGPGSVSSRGLRGGCWGSFAGGTRVAVRLNVVPDYRDAGLGFRLSRTIP
ncbi:MAG: SUMF1/EgtB/PvdO family nonheme iron enzyme, partial [Myxococcota bacterium]|nr:SUMF1/EgtB/PvdO family nonheme iron enzyme [Myxococcota bacterium]